MRTPLFRLGFAGLSSLLVVAAVACGGGKEVLSQVAEVIRSDKDLNNRYFLVAGHTDNCLLYTSRCV